MTIDKFKDTTKKKWYHYWLDTDFKKMVRDDWCYAIMADQLNWRVRDVYRSDGEYLHSQEWTSKLIEHGFIFQQKDKR